jgi:phosphoribosylaminoimidazole-succinocarboxamide synthase
MFRDLVLHTSDYGFMPARSGKVRDIFDLGDTLLIVATDRISAFDVVLPNGIPNKGRVLTKISSFWFRKLSHFVRSHFISADVSDFPEPYCNHPGVFGERSMLVKKMDAIPIECVVRGYLSGSAWNEYKRSQSICGVGLRAGLVESARLDAPVFTPSTKAGQGEHDQNITFDEVAELVSDSVANIIRESSLLLYRNAVSYAESRGIIIADTKFEFGIDKGGEIVWIDEAITPDSSRLWPAFMYREGQPQPSFDKQYVRDYLLRIAWERTGPPPILPPEVIRMTSQKYSEACRLLTGAVV